MLERAMRYISMTLALAEEDSQCPEPAPPSLMASVKKVKAGLRHAGSQEFQDYPAGVVELGTALDAIDMLANDVARMLEE
jgi:soluble cytochrome b562